MFKATNDFIQVKEVSSSGMETAGNNLKVGEVISIGEQGKSSQTISTDETRVAFKEGDKILFDTNKALKYGEHWYLKGSSVFAFEE